MYDLDEAMEIEYHTEEDYYNLPDERRVELINGIFYDMASPNSVHQTISGELYRLIANYIRSKGGKCRAFHAPYDVKLFPDEDGSIVEPDIMVICDPSKIKKNRCEGVPDWIIEIASPGNREHDYWRKFNLYLDAKVKEYWIVDPEKKTIQVCRLKGDEYTLKKYTFRDKVKPGIYEDLMIDFQEIDQYLEELG